MSFCHSAVMEAVPQFTYHADPVRTGDVRPTDEVCPCCEQLRGMECVNSPYGLQRVEHLCPWCVGSGLAEYKFPLKQDTFEVVSEYFFDGEVSAGVKKEVCCRTPMFATWNVELWLTHCGDAAVHIGDAGYEELEHYLGLREFLVAEMTDPPEYREHILQALQKDGNPLVLVFQCRHCGAYLGLIDGT